MHTKNKFEWCLKKAKEGGKGIREIKSDLKEAKYHIDKALYNLRKMELDTEKNYSKLGVFLQFFLIYYLFLSFFY